MKLSIETQVSQVVQAIRTKDDLAASVHIHKLLSSGVSEETINHFIDKQIKTENDLKDRN